MKQMWLAAVMLLALTGVVAAQADLTLYEEALRLIEEARVNSDTALYLSALSLTALPPEIGQLTQLEYLIVNDNVLTELPPEIGNLAELRRLDVSRNELAALPPEIGALTQLEGLGLSHNALTALPSEIATLSNLQVLFIQNNQLTVLPPQLGRLPNLQIFDVYGNPLTFPPPDVVEQGTPAVLDYLRRPQPPRTPGGAFWLALTGLAAGVGVTLRGFASWGRRV